MQQSLTSHNWRISYRTSALNPEGNPTDILHEFYLPALRLISSYDRVAGYFRSSSLAAASQGFTSFLGHGGKMRLIVGADMAEQDVTAILQGDRERLTARLLTELNDSSTWSAQVYSGVGLLSQMVASGQLEVRVAFRVHFMTGAPLAMDAMDDGYVHEKWFIMGDTKGNHLYGSGSLNESKTSLLLNAENIDIHLDWEGGSSRERVRQAQADFEKLWENAVPHMAVMTIPEAVRQRLIDIATTVDVAREIDGTTRQEDVKPSLKELLKFAVLKDAPRMPGGRYVGMYSAPVELWPHQEIVSRRLVETWPYSYLLCDEVGLGKTIEAALAIRSLYLSGMARRVLIVAPASLTHQWQRELAQKAMLPFARTTGSPQIRHSYIFPDERNMDDHDLYGPGLNILSSGLLSRKERTEALRLHPRQYDIALVDEAHYARRQNSRESDLKEPNYGKLYEAMESALRLKARSLWMATATPMQIDPIEVYDLLKLTNRVASYQYDPSAALIYFQIMGKLVSGEAVEPYEWSYLGISWQQIKGTDPYLWDYLNTTTVNANNRRLLDDLPYPNKAPRQQDYRYLPRPLFAASPLSRVMMRHTRKLLEIYRENGELKSNLAKRHVLPLRPIRFTQRERVLYEQLEEYCAELRKQISQASGQSKQMLHFYLSFLQLRFASSIYAIQMTLKRRLDKVRNTLNSGLGDMPSVADIEEQLDQMLEDHKIGVSEEDMSEIQFRATLKNRSEADLHWEEDKLKKMLYHMSQITETPSKLQELLSVLEMRRIAGTERIEQTVLFTRFLDTIKSIRSYLHNRNPRMRIGLYSGQHAYHYDPTRGKDRSITHEELKRLFLIGEVDLLLCTDAAAEGLNLQTADMLINFDLGWNPMKVEQRIGRIDRIGQKHTDIQVMNMCYLGSAEEIVYGRLLERLRKANLIVGAQQISLLPVEPDDFRDLEEKVITEDQLMQRAQENLQRQRRTNASMEMTAQDQYTMYSKMTQKMRAQQIPAKLEDIWDALTSSAYLKACGAQLDEREHTWRLPFVELHPQINGTINRDNISPDTDFLTWGNWKFDMLLDELAEKLPKDAGCIQRISVEQEGFEVAGYIVATKGGQCLVTSYSDLNGLELDESAAISDKEVRFWQGELKKKADEEYKSISHAIKAENLNLKVASLHSHFISMLAVSLLENAFQDGGVEKFKSALPWIDEYELRYLTLPPDGFLGRESELLFHVNIAAGKMNIPINDLMLTLAKAHAIRAAESLKMKKSEIRTQDVIRRIKAADRSTILRTDSV